MTKQDFLDKLKQQINHLPQRITKKSLTILQIILTRLVLTMNKLFLKNWKSRGHCQELLKALDLPEKTRRR
ncbi:hypothetical protein [Streptococcus equi]|uniref:hypothetical protein n=1 Tax=Streptococcus equi TaxID=1336 RepID=UPI001E617ABF|nr:hypothetical protein [Streptococcus equi]